MNHHQSLLRHRSALVGAAIAIAAGVSGCASTAKPAASSTVTVTRNATPARTATPVVPPSLAGTMPAGKAGTPRGGVLNLADVDQSNASAVAIAAMRASLGVDTRIDATRFDAQRRSAPLLAPKLAALSRGPAGGNGGIDATWTQLAAHHGYSAVTATSTPQEGQPADTPTTAVRSLTVRVISHGDRGWTSKGTPALWIVTLTREPVGWRVANVQDLGDT